MNPDGSGKQEMFEYRIAEPGETIEDEYLPHSVHELRNHRRRDHSPGLRRRPPTPITGWIWFDGNVANRFAGRKLTRGL